MNQDQKKVLAKAAKHIVAICEIAAKCDEDKFASLKEACDAATKTNCGWATYRAAQVLKEEVEAELAMRTKVRPSKLAPHLTEHGRKTPSHLESH